MHERDVVVYSILEDGQEYYWTETMFEEIKEGNNMKELTFREVIANIKEGEVYRNSEDCFLLRFICMEKGQIILKQAGRYVVRELAVDDKMRFVKVREEYTFQEAFEAYIKGKVIQSCVDGELFYLEDEDFETKQIKGKWYIND